MTKIKIIFFSLSFFFISLSSYAQTANMEIGAGLGIGSIKGNSPSITSLFGNILLGYKPAFLNGFTFRLNFLFARKVEYFLPQNRTDRYYPFIKAFNFLGFIEQPLSDNFFLEEGLGFVLLNDRTFSDVDAWDFGIAGNILTGVHLWDFDRKGFTLGLGTEFGNTFTNSTASYFNFYFQARYSFVL